MTIFDEGTLPGEVPPPPPGPEVGIDIVLINLTYIPSPDQTDPEAQARATELGVNLGSRVIPPNYAPFCDPLPGIQGTALKTTDMVGWIYDDGSPTMASVNVQKAVWRDAETAHQTSYTNKLSNRGDAAWAMMAQLQTALDRTPYLPADGNQLSPAEITSWLRECQIDIQVMAAIERKIMRWLGDKWDQPN